MDCELFCQNPRGFFLIKPWLKGYGRSPIYRSKINSADYILIKLNRYTARSIGSRICGIDLNIQYGTAFVWSQINGLKSKNRIVTLSLILALHLDSNGWKPVFPPPAPRGGGTAHCPWRTFTGAGPCRDLVRYSPSQPMLYDAETKVNQGGGSYRVLHSRVPWKRYGMNSRR